MYRRPTVARDGLSPATQDPAFGGSILPRAPIRGTNGFDAERPDALDDGRAENGVTVEDEIPRRGVVWERLAQRKNWHAR